MKRIYALIAMNTAMATSVLAAEETRCGFVAFSTEHGYILSGEMVYSFLAPQDGGATNTLQLAIDEQREVCITGEEVEGQFWVTSADKIEFLDLDA